MKVFDSENIRNIALVGHGDSGKTSLASALLYSAGAVNRLGRVDAEQLMSHVEKMVSYGPHRIKGMRVNL